jgi:hypothetical protein
MTLPDSGYRFQSRLNVAHNSRMVDAFVPRMDSVTTLPLGSITATEIVA